MAKADASLLGLAGVGGSSDRGAPSDVAIGTSGVRSVQNRRVYTKVMVICRSWSGESASSVRTMDVGDWVYCVGGVHEGKSGFVVKKHAVMISFKAGDGATYRVMRYNLRVVPAPSSEDLSDDAVEVENTWAPNDHLVRLLSDTLRAIAPDGHVNRRVWMKCCDVVGERVFGGQQQSP